MRTQKILLSLGMIVFVGALAAGATGAFFSDTETSTGNTFAAGSLDLKVDSQSHYNGMKCSNQNGFGSAYVWIPDAAPSVFTPADATVFNTANPDQYPQAGTPCGGTWAESDLIEDSVAFRFFDFGDIKPGDQGEDTISLHVYDNDAWGCFIVDNVVDSDVTCTEPESEDADDASCTPAGNVAVGELGAALTFDAWLDEGAVAGFQCNNANAVPTVGASCAADLLEGDNILNGVEVLFWNDETVDEASEGPFAMSNILAAAHTAHACTDTDGNTSYGSCHGLAADGRMVGSATYYWGLAWNVPASAGNEIQTDQLTMDMIFEVQQHRNNPNFQCTTPEVRTTLTLAKTVVPAQVAPDSAFTLTATGPTAGVTGIEGSAGVFLKSVAPGVYDLSESGGPIGASVAWSCSIPMNDADTVTVPAGANVVCTVTNTYNLNN